MATTPYYNAAKLNKLDGDVKFGEGLPHIKGIDTYDRDADEDDAPVALDLSIRRGRLVLMTVIAVASISAATIYFNHGLELSTFDVKTKNTTEQNAMLDDYNSYTGNIASAFGKPIEIFVTLAVQVIVLRLMVSAMLKPELGWKVGIVTLALSAAVGYLISNGFNALNVQLRPLEIKPFISDGDLEYGAAESMAALSSSSEDWTKTTTENVPKNAITNTILREVVTTRVPKAPPICNWFFGADTGFGDVPDYTLNIGFTQRDWQTRVLQEALEPKQLRVVANATDRNVNRNVKADDLPMNASLAADLFIYGMAVGKWLFPWGYHAGFAGNTSDVANRNPSNPKSAIIEPTAVVSGLLPLRSAGATETGKREWFLRESQKAVLRQMRSVGAKVESSLADVSMEFSHIDITSSLQFDAITFEFDVEPTSLSNVTENPATRYLKLTPTKSCGPWPSLCVVPKTTITDSTNYLYYDTPVQIGTFAACVNDAGGEELMTAWPLDPKTAFNGTQCKRTSNSSLLVVSIGKRILADGLWQNRSFESSNLVSGKDSAVVKNLRKVYSYTIGRLSWSLSDLSSAFNATCSTNSTNCMGLQLPLIGAAKDAAQQQLIVGTNALPLNMVPVLPEQFLMYKPRLMPLVKLNEPQRFLPNGNAWYDEPVGDVLLPHNIKSVEWDMNQRIVTSKQFTQSGSCNPYVEDRIYLALRNHHYMEHSLQPAYTAATFFLFQNGVVKDAVKLDDKHSTLNFANNKQDVALFVSIPNRNAWLTLAGCAVLVLCLAYVLLLSICRKNSGRGAALGGIKEPQVIARVMLDEAQFPPAVLHRRVVRKAGNEKDLRHLDEFIINGISLQPQEDQVRSAGSARK